jgi:hypothetical protein
MPAMRTSLGPEDHGEPWHLTLTFTDVTGRTELVGVAIVAVDENDEPLMDAGRVRQDRRPAQALPPSALRDLPLARIVQDAKTRLWDEYERFLATSDGGSDLPKPKRRKRPVRPSYWTEERLREVAHVYESAFAEGARPRLAVAKALGVSEDTASRAIRKARDSGVLGEPPGPGRAGTSGMTEESER